MTNPEVGVWLGEDGTISRPDPGNLYRYVLNNPVNFVDPMGLTAQPPGPNAAPTKEEIQFIADLKKKYASFPEARKLLGEAVTENGTLQLGIARGAKFGGYFRPKDKVILVPVQDIDKAVGYLLFEVIRARNVKQYNAINNAADAGTLGRNEFATKHETLGFSYTKMHKEIAERAIKGGFWAPSSNIYNNSWPTLEECLKAQDTPKPGAGPDETHTGWLRQEWDAQYKNKYEDRQRQRKP